MKNIAMISAVIVAILGAAYVFFGSNNQPSEGLVVAPVSSGAVVGVVAPLSGENASYGDILRRGFDLAFEGSPHKLKYEDSRFEAKGSVAAFEKLISVDNVQIVLGEVASGNTSAMLPVANRNEVVLFSSISSADSLRANDFFFRNIPSNDVQGETVARFLIENLGIKTVALFGLNDEYGTNIISSFKAVFTSLGGRVVFEDQHQRGQNDFRTVLAKIGSSGADALFIPGNKNEPAIILRQARELGLDIPILGGDGSSNEDVVKAAGASSEGFYTSNVMVDKESNYYKDYYERYTARYDREPGAYDAYAYEAANIVLRALGDVGNDSVRLREYLNSSTFESMTGVLSFTEDGDVRRLWGMYQVVEGEFVAIGTQAE